MALKKSSIAGLAARAVKAGAEKAGQAIRPDSGAIAGGLPMTVKSHDKGKNATVTLYADRIERVLERSALSLSRSSQEAEVIPVRSISSVSSRKDGMTYTVVSAITGGNTIDFRLAHTDAAAFKAALTDLVLGSHAPAVTTAAPDVLAQLKNLADLHASGALSDEEFAAAKALLIG